MKEQKVEQLVFDDGEGGEDYYLVLDRFKNDGQTYAFMLEMEDETTVLQKDKKPVFIVMREDGEDFFDLSKEETDKVSLKIKEYWSTLNERLRSLEGYAD